MSISKNFVNYKVAVLIIYGCFLISLSVFKTTEVLLPTIYQMERWLGGDKLMHLTLSSVLSFLALWALMPSTSASLKIFALTCLGICLLLISGLLVDEFHQAFVASRRFEWLDFSYGVGGVGIGCSVYLIACFIAYLPKLTHKY